MILGKWGILGVFGSPPTEDTALAKLAILDYELYFHGELVAFKDRANREIIKVKPSNGAGIAVCEDGYLDWENNSISKIEILCSDGVISTEGEQITVSESQLKDRLGDLPLEPGANKWSLVFYVDSDKKGIVACHPGTKSYTPIKCWNL